MSKSFFKTEAAAGITTFFTMVYIVVVIPSMLSSSPSGSEIGMPFSGVMTATVLLSFLMTLLMGTYAKLPFAVGPGMGISALFTFTIIQRNHVPWPIALGMVFWAGIIFLAASLTPVRKKIADAIPECLRLAATSGIGFFLSFIGLKQLGIVAADPVTFVRLGSFERTTFFGMIGLSLMVMLLHKKNPFAFLAGIATTTFLGIISGNVRLPEHWISMPDFTSVFLKLDIVGALQITLLPSILSIFFTDLFDSISTFMGCAYAGDLIGKNGQPKNLREGLIVDSWATLIAGLLGTSAGTAYIESAAGIEVGGRTGLTSIITALCFLPCLFLGPLAGMVPAYATAPVLILVGALMFRNVTRLNLNKLEELVPSFLTIILIPLTFSITQGILWGLISYVILFLLAGRKREIQTSLYAVSAVCAALLFIENMSSIATAIAP